MKILFSDPIFFSLYLRKLFSNNKNIYIFLMGQYKISVISLTLYKFISRYIRRE